MLSTQLDQYGKTSLTWKHIKTWVMKNGQDLMLLKPDEFIYMQTESHGLMTRDGWITQTHRQPHVVEHKSRNCIALHCTCSAITTDELFVLVGQNVIKKTKLCHLAWLLSTKTHKLPNSISILLSFLRWLRWHWKTNLFLISWYTIHSYAKRKPLEQ